MPRKLKINLEFLLDTIVSNKEYIIDPINGNIHPPSAKCFDNISMKLDRAISSKNIYTIVKLNRYDVKVKLGLGITYTKIK